MKWNCEWRFRRLKNYEILTKSFEAAGLRYMPGCAAMFGRIDLRNLLTEVCEPPHSMEPTYLIG